MPISALLLVLAAATIHATWNLLAKRVRGGMEAVWIYSAAGAVLYAPWGLWEYARHWHRLGWAEAIALGGSCAWQLGYFVCLQQAYKHGDLSLVYPIARGAGPLVATVGALLLFAESPSPLAWTGIACISGGVLFFLHGGKSALPGALWGLATGCLIGSYSLWDKNAISNLHLPPILIEWTTDVSRAILLAPLALARPAETRDLWKRRPAALLGIAALNPLAYILVLTALTMAPLHRVAPMREISIVLGAVFGARFLGETQGRRRMVGACIMVAGVLLLTGCSQPPERPDFHPRFLRAIELTVIPVPPPPPLEMEPTDDEAEIQFRAAIPFYASQRWSYAAAAFAEVLEIDRDRDDARYLLGACLLLGGSPSEAVPQLEQLLETEYEMRARSLLAHALYVLGRPVEAREAAALAAAEDYHAAGWVARYDLLVH